MIAKSLALATALTLGLASSAAAKSYDFSYIFNTGQHVTGSFTGTAAAGGLVTNLTNVTASIDGTPLAGPLVAHGYTGYSGPTGSNCGMASCFNGVAVAAFDPAQNNFFFADYTAAAGFPGTNYFYIIPWNNGGSNQVATQAHFADGSQINAYNGQYVAGNWSLSADVPEPASWLLMIAGFALTGVAARRRTRVAA